MWILVIKPLASSLVELSTILKWAKHKQIPLIIVLVMLIVFNFTMRQGKTIPPQYLLSVLGKAQCFVFHMQTDACENNFFFRFCWNQCDLIQMRKIVVVFSLFLTLFSLSFSLPLASSQLLNFPLYRLVFLYIGSKYDKFNFCRLMEIVSILLFVLFIHLDRMNFDFCKHYFYRNRHRRRHVHRKNDPFYIYSINVNNKYVCCL